ncbi:MAG: carboxypeptidase regulatory-like domain-containing protein [Ignavibacteriaceae bacterium]|nr:carboxypeptidase regulatory-like domain-containing protein [Ignavibacteriaceae bacterium]
MKIKSAAISFLLVLFILFLPQKLHSQGVTTASMNGIVKDITGELLPAASVMAIHEPTGTKYGAYTTIDGRFSLPNLKIGGPYSVTVTYVGYKKEEQKNIFLNLGQNFRVEFVLQGEAVNLKEITVLAEKDNTLNSSRTGAATYISTAQVAEMPSIKRSTRDITRLDPRSDGNFSFGGKNWLFNNISLDGSYFNNSFGLDDPAPGGQTNAEPVPFDAVAEVQVSVAPFDVREGGFTGAGINTVTKSGTNDYKASLYSFMRNENLVGNKVSGNKVVANPSLFYNQSGFTASGPIIPNTFFIFMNGEVERRKDPGTNFAANTGTSGFGISRVKASDMDKIRERMISVYGYDPGSYENYTNHTDNEKFLIKLDWNINESNNFTFRYNYLNARRDLPPHPFAISYNGTGRGPNENSLPFQNAGYRMNNQLSSFAAELNSRSDKWANRFFASYNRFRDFRKPFSKLYPTIEIAENGITYTTLGNEPFSINNILDQDVWQFTNNFSYFAGNHVITAGVNFESFKFYNSFNLFFAGLFMVPVEYGGTTFSSLNQFFQLTDPANPSFVDFNKIASDAAKNPFKGEDIKVGQLAFYAQDEFLVSEKLTLTYGVRVDIPMYFNDMVDNPFSRSLNLLDADGNPEVVDQSKLPKATPLFSPRVGFNWDVTGDRSTQLRGGTGIFTGRLPFVWIGNNISNPGANPNLPPNMRSFYLNAMTPDFKWPQVWTTNFAVDQKLPEDILGTLEFVYGKDINAIYVRDANLGKVKGYLPAPDGRSVYSGPINNNIGGAYVIDNASEGYNYSITAQLRKNFDFGLNTSLSYTYLEAKSLMKSTEIASVLYGENAIQANPNKPYLSNSEFGNRNRIVASATYRHEWSESWATSIGVFAELAEGNRFSGAGGNRYSYIYSGDVNGDGSGSNDLIYIPRNQSEIIFDPYVDASGNTISAQEQWNAFNAFIEQDDYLKNNRGKIADRFGAINPWFSNVDLRLLQDFSFFMGSQKHTIQLSVDILNVANLLNSSWGVRQVANSAATSPLQYVKTDAQGAPVFKFNTNLKKTFIDDPGVLSRWQMQVGIRYLFN